MVIEHRILNLLGKKVFEKAVVTPPFKNLNPLPNEACLLYVTEGSNNSYSEEEHISVRQEEGVLMKCGNYCMMVYLIPPPDTSESLPFIFIRGNAKDL